MNLEGNVTSKQALKGVLAIRQGIDGKDGYTPQKGIDYFDGEKGEQGEVSIAYADNHYSPSIVCSASGEVVTTTDSAKVKPKNIKLFGKGKQRQYEGNQFLKYSFPIGYTETRNGVTFTFLEDGGIKVVGTNNNSSQIDFTIIDKDSCYVPNGDYTLSIEGQTYEKCFVCFWNDWNSFFDGFHYDFAITPINRGTITNGNLHGCISVFANQTVNTTIYVMLNAGTEPKPHEPFVGNEPSPNMNYPQIPEFLGESGSIGGKVLNKNQFDPYHATTRVINGVDFVVNDDKTITVNGTATADIAYSLGYFIIKYGKKYKSSGCPSGGSVNTYYFTIGIFSNDYGLGGKGWCDTGDYNAWCAIVIKTGTTVSNLTFKPMIRYADIEDDTYEPYTEQPFTFQTPNGLRGIPLGQTIPDAIKNSPIHMSGVYWDGEQYQIADTENEDGKDVQRIIHKAGCKFTKDTEGTYARYVCYPSETIFADEILCSHSIFNTNSSVNEKGCRVNRNYNAIYIFDDINEEGYIEVDVWFVLADPIITDTTDQLEVVMNYPNTTIVNDAGAYMEVEYVADTKCYIDNKFKEMTSAIAQLL